jgi:hypothetical protein
MHIAIELRDLKQSIDTVKDCRLEVVNYSNATWEKHDRVGKYLIGQYDAICAAVLNDAEVSRG